MQKSICTVKLYFSYWILNYLQKLILNIIFDTMYKKYYPEQLKTDFTYISYLKARNANALQRNNNKNIKSYYYRIISY